MKGYWGQIRPQHGELCCLRIPCDLQDFVIWGSKRSLLLVLTEALTQVSKKEKEISSAVSWRMSLRWWTSIQLEMPGTGEIKRFQLPRAVFPVYRGTTAKVWVVVWLRGSSKMWSNSQGLVPRKGRHGGPRVNPAELPWKQQARKVVSLCKLSNPHQWIWIQQSFKLFERSID